MKREEYEKLLEKVLKAIDLGGGSSARECLYKIVSDLDLRESGGESHGVDADVVTSLASTFLQERAKSNSRSQVLKDATKYGWKCFCDGSLTIQQVADMYKCSPYLLVRSIVRYKFEQVQGVAISKKGLGQLMRSPQLIDCEKLRMQVLDCIEADVSFSPYHDRIREVIGDEHEFILRRKLSARGVYFKTENDLREIGMSKTPDMRLEVPIIVSGTSGENRLINWIDSKAMFGDPVSYASHCAQFQGYVNRFGPGLVIYWFGFVDDLNNDADVLLSHGIPEIITS